MERNSNLSETGTMIEGDPIIEEVNSDVTSSKEVLEKEVGRKIRKKIASYMMVCRSRRLMEAQALSTLVKADNRASVKSLEMVNMHQGGKPSILGSILIDVLFNNCNKEHLIHIGSKSGLDSSKPFNPVYGMIDMQGEDKCPLILPYDHYFLESAGFGKPH